MLRQNTRSENAALIDPRGQLTYVSRIRVTMCNACKRFRRYRGSIVLWERQ